MGKIFFIYADAWVLHNRYNPAKIKYNYGYKTGRYELSKTLTNWVLKKILLF
jgi:hypothetical protein